MKDDGNMSSAEKINMDEYMIHAYVDGQLSEEDVRLVEEHLQAHPDDLAYVNSIQKQNAMLKESFDPVLEEEIPDFLLETVEKEKKPNRFSFPSYKVASFLLPLAFGGVLGWFLKPAVSLNAFTSEAPVAFVKDAMLAHVMYTAEQKHPVDVTSEHEKHLVAWISKRLGIDINAPDLSNQGFHLVGGRLLPNEAGPSAQFMYEDGSQQRLTLYVNKNFDKKETAFEYFQDKGVSAFYWVDRSLVYALTGKIDREQLLSVSHEIYQFYNHPLEKGTVKKTSSI